MCRFIKCMGSTGLALRTKSKELPVALPRFGLLTMLPTFRRQHFMFSLGCISGVRLLLEVVNFLLLYKERDTLYMLLAILKSFYALSHVTASYLLASSRFSSLAARTSIQVSRVEKKWKELSRHVSFSVLLISNSLCT